jgi:hypothetical protein
MNLLDIMKARRKSGKPPTITGRRWKVEEQERLSQGLCVVCGDQPAQAYSYICASCEEEDSIEDIRSEIQRLRARILGK